MRKNMKKILKSFALVAFASSVLVTQSVWAQATYYWDANGTTAGFGTAGGTWGTSAFVTTDPAGLLAPALTATTFNDTLNLGNSTNGLGAGTIGVNSSQSISNLNVGAGSGAITLSGGQIAMTGNLLNSSTNLLTIGSGITITSSRSFTTSTNGGDITVNGVIGGTGGNISKRGSGTLILGAANTNTAGIRISGGTVKLGVAQVPGPGGAPGVVTVLNGVYDIAGFSANITNFPGLVMGASAQSSLAGSTASVIDSVGGGVITFGTGTSQKIQYYAATNQDNGAATISANLNLSGGNTQIYVERSTNSGSADLTISGNIVGGVQLIKINSGAAGLGMGTLVLSGTNSFTSTLNVVAGTVVGIGDGPADGTANWCGTAPQFSGQASINLGGSATSNNYAPTLLLGGAYRLDRGIQIGSSNPSGNGAYNATIGGRNTSGTAFFTGVIWLLTPNISPYTVTLQAATGGTVMFTNGAGGGYFANTGGKTINIGSSGNNGIVNIANDIQNSAGAINVNYGTLLLNGNWATQTGVWTVTNGATLGGRGAIGGSVAMLSGALATNTIVFDTNGVVISQLTFSNTVALNANTIKVATPYALAAGDYLLWTNAAGGFTGSMASPAVVGGAGLAANHTNSVVTTANAIVLHVAASTPPTATLTNTLITTISGPAVVLSWPSGQGWKLESQTNNLNQGLGNNWSTNTTATTPFTNNIDPANPAVFYRLTQ
jgi:autotransporter-associated beta strand protein